jgi:hypothetical protein
MALLTEGEINLQDEIFLYAIPARWQVSFRRVIWDLSPVVYSSVESEQFVAQKRLRNEGSKPSV